MEDFCDDYWRDSGKFPLAIARTMLRYLCLWPGDRRKSVAVVRIASFVNVAVMGVAHLVYMLAHVTDVGVMASTCTTVSTTIQTVSKMLLLHVRAERLRTVLTLTSDEFWPANAAGVEEEAKVLFGSRIVVATLCTYLTSAFLSCWDFMALPLVVGNRELPLQSWFPFAWDGSPLYELLYVWHFLTNSFFVVHTIAGHDFLLNSMLTCCVSQFKLLNSVLKTIGARDYRTLVACIRHHVTLLNACGTLERIYGEIILLQFFLSATAICVSTFVLTKYDGYLMKMLSFSTAHLVQFFFLCVIGNQIIHQSVSVADAAYESSWYVDNQPAVGRALCLVIQRSVHREQKLTAARIADLDLRNFIRVLRMSFSFYTLLSAIKGDENK